MIRGDIEKYLESNLFDELGLKEMDDNSKFLILSKLAEVVYLRFVNYLVEVLPEEVQEKLDEILESNKLDEFEKLVNDYVPNYNDVLKEIIAEEKKRLIEIKV